MDWYAENEKVDNLFLYYDCTSGRHRELFGVRSQDVTSTTVVCNRLGWQEGFRFVFIFLRLLTDFGISCSVIS